MLALNKFGKFYHFYNSHLLAGTTQIIFLVGNGISLAHVSVIAKRYNSPMRHEVWPCLHSKYFGKLSHLYHLSIIRLRLWKFGACSSWAELRPHYPFPWESDCPFSQKSLVRFVIFEILFHLAATSENNFCVKYSAKLDHLLVASKFYNSLIPLNEVWPGLSPKYFGKFLHIYQMCIARLHLWRFGVCNITPFFWVSTALSS